MKTKKPLPPRRPSLAARWCAFLLAAWALVVAPAAHAQRLPGTGPVGTPIRTPFGAAQLWTPRYLPGTLGYVQVPKVGSGAHLSLSGSAVVAMSDAGNGPLLLTQATGSKRPTYTTASLLDGHAAIVLSSTNASELIAASGGPTGEDVAHYTWAIVSHPNTSGFRGITGFGASSTSAVNSFLGTAGTAIWAGRGGNGSPSFSDDASVHLVEKYFDGTTVYALQDGAIKAVHADAGYNLVSSEFGLGRGFSGTADATLYAAGWGTGAIAGIDGASPRHRLAQWVRRVYPSLAKPRLVVAFGDSQTAGFGATVAPNNWPTLLSSNGLVYSYSVTLTAVAGWTTSNIQSNYATSGGLWLPSGLRLQNVAVVWAGTNDLYGGDTAANAWSRLQTICSNLKAAGFTVVVLTALPRQDAGVAGTYEAERLLFNASIRAGWPAIAHRLLDVALRAEFADPLDTTWFQADKVHITVLASNLIAQLVATILNAFG